ncbi:MAG TPA: tyrosine--tRNA ligase, partial [Bacteroidia bacterium]|nr:tyrosine--tRNA ligase [Bacteroidia bacterium]
YDFYYLWKHHGVKMQMGGSDQLGNIYTGTELIRRKDGGEAWGLATPLIKKADGTKFGKTESGNIWLDPKRTSPYEFYQFWLNAADSDSENYIRIFTLKSKEEIEKLEAEHKAEPHLRKLQKALAEDITIRVHGEESLKATLEATELFFGKGTAEQLAALDQSHFHKLIAASGMPVVEVAKTEFEKGIGLIDMLSGISKLCESNGDARKLIQGNGVSVNKQKVNDPKAVVGADKLINGKYILLQKGKKDFCLAKVV